MHVKGGKTKAWTTAGEAAKFWAAVEGQQLKRLAEQIKTRRKALGWTAEELAHHSRVSWRAISRLENCETKEPRDRTIRELAEALKCTPEALTGPRLAVADAQALEEERLERIEQRLGEVLAHLTKKPLTEFFPVKPAVAPGGGSGQRPPKAGRRRGQGAGKTPPASG